MIPNKLIWEEHHYFGFKYLIKLTADGISLQKSTVCIPFTIEPYCLVRPTDDQWNQFHASLLSLNLDPVPPEETMCDGFEVSCDIRYRGLRVKFEMINPEFHGFEGLSGLVNELTICEHHPEGLLLDISDD